MHGSIFSESWFKVSSLRVKLNTKNYIKKQKYRGALWYVIEDKYNNQFFKVTPEAYQFIMRLDFDKTVEEVWESCLEHFPDMAPSQDDVIQLLTSLHHKNLLLFKNIVDSDQLYHRDSVKKTAQTKGKLFSFLYFKIPLFDPDNFLDRINFISEFLFSKYSFYVWIVTLLIALKYVLENIDSIYDQSQGMLSPNNLFLLYICIIFLKVLHEFGHSMMVKKFGGRVNTMGVVILIFTPIPYMDATQSWLFRSKYQRALVGSAGMIVELFIAAIATIIWANTGEGVLNSICFNIMIIGSISSIFFNGNPLLRFDAYFILSDLLEIPNLYERSKKQWYYWIEKYIFNISATLSPSSSNKEAFWMATYAILSLLYRLFVALIIALFIADQWFILGVLVVLISIYMWILKPLVSLNNYLLYDRKLYRSRLRAMSIITSVSLTFIITLIFIPYSYSIKADGVVQSDNHQHLYIQSEGYLKEIRVENGEYVKQGEVLVTFQNDEIDFEIEKIEYAIQESKAYLQKAVGNLKADVVAVRKHISLLEDKLIFFEKKKEKLHITAKYDGYFVYSDQNFIYKKERWYKKGDKVGMLIPKDGVYFLAAVTQEQSSALFKEEKLNAQIKFHGNTKEIIDADTLNVLPYEKDILPSAALGWLGGGDIPVVRDDPSGTRTTENFFEVKVEFPNKEGLKFYHGRTGRLKIQLQNRTFFDRAVLKVQQVLQKHYKI